MTEVTNYVALPFIVTDDGIGAGEPTEYFNPTAGMCLRGGKISRPTKAQWCR
jgi:hypothetical protein